MRTQRRISIASAPNSGPDDDVAAASFPLSAARAHPPGSYRCAPTSAGAAAASLAPVADDATPSKSVAAPPSDVAAAPSDIGGHAQSRCATAAAVRTRSPLRSTLARAQRSAASLMSVSRT